MQKGNVLIFLLVGIVVLAAIGGAFYLGKQATPKPSPVAISQTPQPTAVQQPSPVSDETANWKTYTDNYTSFKYPEVWDISGTVITSGSPKIRLVVVPKDGTLMNECMELASEEVKNGLMIKRFVKVTTGAMCEGSDPSPRETWVVPSKGAYSPGISYEYTANESKQAEEIFNQILSTFKFTN